MIFDLELLLILLLDNFKASLLQRKIWLVGAGLVIDYLSFGHESQNGWLQEWTIVVPILYKEDNLTKWGSMRLFAQWRPLLHHRIVPCQNKNGQSSAVIINQNQHCIISRLFQVIYGQTDWFIWLWLVPIKMGRPSSDCSTYLALARYICTTKN